MQLFYFSIFVPTIGFPFMALDKLPCSIPSIINPGIPSWANFKVSSTLWIMPPVTSTPDEPSSGGGGGGGGGSRPIAMIEVTPDQTIVHPIVDETKTALAGIALGAWMFLLLFLTLRAIFGSDETQ